MNTFKRKALMTAVAAGLGVAAGSADAVFLNPNGTGQVLIYPYYTVNSKGGNAFNTYISIVNTTTQAKALRVRFREGKTSAEVLDFNLFLSPNDMWTAGLRPSSASDAAQLFTTDVSCTNPQIPAAGVDFRNYGYLASVAAAEAAPGTGLDRTREGYLEVFEMAILSGSSAGFATHNSAGTPANCTALRAAIATLTFGAPTGGLTGTGTLINVNNGVSMGYNAQALEDFYAAGVVSDVGLDTPNMTSADPHSFKIYGLTGVYELFASPVDAVSSVFMHTDVMNEFVLDAGPAAQTDWVLTFPTKRYYINSTTGAATTPFTGTLGAGGACENISFSFVNREEAGATPSGIDFSPAPSTPTTSVCWESTVLSFRNSTGVTPAASATALGSTSGVLYSNNTLGVPITTSAQNGWATVSFIGTNALAGFAGIGGNAINLRTGVSAGSLETYHGLPVTGFMVDTFSNGLLTCGSATCQGNYGNLYWHNYRNNVTP